MTDLDDSNLTAISADLKDSKISTVTGLPQKRFFRQHAHSNPLANHFFSYSIRPDHVDWSTYYPKYFKSKEDSSNDHQKQVDFIDIGCGFGGLLIKLAELYPNNLSLGMEIRVKGI